MDHSQPGLMRIGTFAQMSRISVRMLRYYQDQRLLEPASVDPWTGHRYYSPAQLLQARLVVALREAGFSVEATAALLPQLRDPSSVAAAFAAQRNELIASKEKIDDQLAALDRISTQLKEQSMFEITTIDLPEMIIVALRGKLENYQEESKLWDAFVPLTMSANLPLTPDGLCGATYYEGESQSNQVDVEIWGQLTDIHQVREPLQCRVVPVQHVVSTRLLGDYTGWPNASAALGTYIAKHNLMTGPMFGIYRVSPAQSQNPAEWVTDVCLPIIG